MNPMHFCKKCNSYNHFGNLLVPSRFDSDSVSTLLDANSRDKNANVKNNIQEWKHSSNLRRTRCPLIIHILNYNAIKKLEYIYTIKLYKPKPSTGINYTENGKWYGMGSKDNTLCTAFTFAFACTYNLYHKLLWNGVSRDNKYFMFLNFCLSGTRMRLSWISQLSFSQTSNQDVTQATIISMPNLEVCFQAHTNSHWAPSSITEPHRCSGELYHNNQGEPERKPQNKAKALQLS